MKAYSIYVPPGGNHRAAPARPHGLAHSAPTLGQPQPSAPFTILTNAQRSLTRFAIALGCVGVSISSAHADETKASVSGQLQSCFVSHFENTEAIWECIETTAAICGVEYDAKQQCLIDDGQQAEVRILSAFADHLATDLAASDSSKDKMHLFVRHARDRGELECQHQRELREVDGRSDDEANLCALTTTVKVVRKALTLMGHDEVQRRFAQE